MKKLVIFDLDGTLLNTIADLAHSTNYALNKLGYPTHEIEKYNFMVGNGIDKLFERALPEGEKSKENVLRVRKEFVPYYDIHNADDSRPYPGIPELLSYLQDAGIQIVFISNNVEERVATFAKGLNIPFYPFAMKPLPKTYRKMLKDFHVKRDVVAVLGDQLMTDILGANVMRFYTILTAQVVERDLSFTKVNRVFENIVFSLLKVTGKLVKGEYDE